MNANSVTFSPVVGARERVFLLGPSGVLFHRIVNSIRSLQGSEYVAFDHLWKNEPNDCVANSVLVAAVRQWYWGRKRDRGFLLTSFPVTLGHALVLDEWMDAREETLSACLWIDQTYAQAAAEAARCHVCPEDGRIGYADTEATGLLPRCESCGATMQPHAREALAAVDHWYQWANRHGQELIRHYTGLGFLQRLDAAVPEGADVTIS